MITTTSNVSRHPHTGRVVVSDEELVTILALLATAVEVTEDPDLARLGMALCEAAAQDQEDSENYHRNDMAYL